MIMQRGIAVGVCGDSHWPCKYTAHRRPWMDVGKWSYESSHSQTRN